MPQLIKPATKIRVVPRDGELEITLNINITVDGKVSADAEGADVSVKEDKTDEPQRIIPDFLSGLKLDFGKKD